jgi:hypothetical protein
MEALKLYIEAANKGHISAWALLSIRNYIWISRTLKQSW